MICHGTDAQFYIEQSDGSWQPIAIDSVTITREQDLNKERIPVLVQRNLYFEIPIKSVTPRDPRNVLVTMYEIIRKRRCPGSWKTKRLEKKRLKALYDFSCS